MVKAMKNSQNEFRAIPITTYSPKTSHTFYPSPNIQSYVIPQGVTSIHVDCVASKGANVNGETDTRGKGGAGGRIQCDIAVIPNQILYFVVGEIPANAKYASYNSSDIRTNKNGITDQTSLESRLIVAGAGGSGGWGGDTGYKQGGVGGGSIGGNGQGTPGTGNKNGFYGTGGTQLEGGISHNNNSNTRGQLGLGGNSVINSYRSCGAGGSGYYGGGGADGTGYHSHDTESWGAGGGGGSSYPPEDNEYCTNVVHTQGYNDGAGYITITHNQGTIPINCHKLYKEQ